MRSTHVWPDNVKPTLNQSPSNISEDHKQILEGVVEKRGKLMK